MAIVYVSPGLATGNNDGTTANDAFQSWADLATAGAAAGSDIRVNADENLTTTVTLGANLNGSGTTAPTRTTITGYSTDWTTPTLRWRNGAGSSANTDGFIIQGLLNNIYFKYIGAKNWTRDGLRTGTTNNSPIFYHCKFNDNGAFGFNCAGGTGRVSAGIYIYCEFSRNGTYGYSAGVANQNSGTHYYSFAKDNVSVNYTCNSNTLFFFCISIGSQYGMYLASYTYNLINCVIDGATVVGLNPYASGVNYHNLAITNCTKAILYSSTAPGIFGFGLLRANNTNADSGTSNPWIIERDVTVSYDPCIDRANGDYRQKAESPGRTVDDVLIGDVVAFNPTYGIQGTDLLYPNLLQCNPSYGSTDGSQVILQGIGLSGCTSLMFGSTSGTITSSSDTVISGAAPALTAGRYDITASGANGIVYISGGFTSVALDRKITTLSQTIGDQDSFITIDIASAEGLFLGASGVTFNGTPVISYTVVSPYLIKAVVPTITPGLYQVEVI
jgi:hypothetical protein